MNLFTKPLMNSVSMTLVIALNFSSLPFSQEAFARSVVAHEVSEQISREVDRIDQEFREGLQARLPNVNSNELVSLTYQVTKEVLSGKSEESLENSALDMKLFLNQRVGALHQSLAEVVHSTIMGRLSEQLQGDRTSLVSEDSQQDPFHPVFAPTVPTPRDGLWEFIGIIVWSLICLALGNICILINGVWHLYQIIKLLK